MESSNTVIYICPKCFTFRELDKAEEYDIFRKTCSCGAMMEKYLENAK